MKRQRKGAVVSAGRKPRRAKPRGGAQSPKAIEIIGLVEALSSDLGAHNGVYLGRGIARLLADAYEQRRQTRPAWVKQLVAHYAGADHAS